MDRGRIGFIVNPIAGMGGRVGLKGTDGREALERALKLGAKPVAPGRALRFLRELKRLGVAAEFYTAGDGMGADVLEEVGYQYSVVLEVAPPTSPEDTRAAAGLVCSLNPDIIVFVGGDGTARDVASAVDERCIVLGVPSGVKMYSSVFSVSPEAAARVVRDYLEGRLAVGYREVLDIDEEAFRRDELKIRLYGYLRVPVEPTLVQGGKEVVSEYGEEENKRAIARYFREIMDEDTLYILGPGTTVKSVADELGVEKTLLGVDAYYRGRLVGRDLNEEGILKLVKSFRKVKLVLSPIGGQGFIVGRGNLQVSPEVLRLIGFENIVVVATRGKMSKIKCLKVDSGDERLDMELSGRYVRVIVDYNEEWMVKIC